MSNARNNAAKNLGDISTTSVNTTAVSAPRNKLINGSCLVAQRGNVVFSASNNLYGGCDRWLTSISATTVTAVVLQVNIGPITASGYCHQVGNVGTTGTTLVQIAQRVEAVHTMGLNSKTVTVSCKVNQQTGAAQNITLSLLKPNAVDTYGATVAIASSGAISVPSGVWTTVSFSYAMGATDGSNGLQVAFAFPGMAAQSNSQFYFGDMQLEIGAAKTSMEIPSYWSELAACQRYYETGTSDILGNAYVTNAYIASVISFKTTKRAAPNVTPTRTYTGGAAATTSGITTNTVSGFSINVQSTGAGPIVEAVDTWVAVIEL
jgi:hypothetical protein